jgi:putative toxin-antitoxin system antitoxin component (TIGR02293 family)
MEASVRELLALPGRTPDAPLPVEYLRFARCLSKAIDTFDGDWEKGATWMLTPNRALCDREPAAIAVQSDGEERVLAVLTRIDHGVYS